MKPHFARRIQALSRFLPIRRAAPLADGLVLRAYAAVSSSIPQPFLFALAATCDGFTDTKGL